MISYKEQFRNRRKERSSDVPVSIQSSYSRNVLYVSLYIALLIIFICVRTLSSINHKIMLAIQIFT